MKTFNLFLFVLLITLSACNNDNNDGFAGPEGCEIKFTILGQEETSNPDVCLYVDNTINIGLIGSNSIQLQVNELSEPTMVTLPSTLGVILVDLEDGRRLAMESGTIEITKISESSAEGVFSGQMRDIADIDLSEPTIALSNGTFRANF
ncbi:MAG: hypothetical protein AAF242_08785 [Bacteroidota bacterium]